ncbi:dihydroorotase [Umezakia ovalisporum]|jgi:dihydroorotase|uniref:Dihydroorotase n=2 Tax=Umezakia ovalisporum TaxID=75695 RepID=A0AA43GYR1_9CYAN|nr:dihydroorotase [Umezakia ovalisporum]MBI1241872.1 dihydroorotase [Nostoc sp. RI_552]MDH6055432.1 dihydroorotase [Umezakia ovalisporum FSS-43]MDH6064132.1 dihydroorotase [Umezakia ovalisporum FSS-62]MDH6068495.1 dihydroorotase [Umezakia ovalisporum APH033B]MDH6069974.1 dihydroorotase [Umezakia ovalisporum CobakiLakeA]
MIELLQQVRVIDPTLEIDQIADVLIADNQIQDLATQITNITPHTQIKNCRGLILGTGLIDIYSHSREPGFEQRETLSSLLQAAAAGGFTRISILPDTCPVIDHPAIVAQLQQKNKPNPNTPHLYIWGGITQNLAGKQLTELGDLAASGVIGFTDNQPWENLDIVQRALEYLQPTKKPVAFFASHSSLSPNGVMRESPEALRLGLPPIPASVETTAIASLLELVAATSTPVHIMRISTARSVELIASAKHRGLPITASTSWMHLLLDTKAIKTYNTSLHLDPPLGNSSDVEALRTGVKERIIDAIAIDHAPYTYEEKVQAFAQSPPGAIGLELALPLLWQHLVETGKFTALQLWRALSTEPAKCLQQKPSAITPKEKAELTLFDPQKTWIVEQKNLHTLSTNTPWLGQELKGRVVKIWV